MTWFKVDDKLAFHGKTLQAGNAAMGAWVRIGAWCSEHETDGAVPAQIASIIATPEELESLIGVGFLEALSGGGFKMHDYLVYNPSHAQLIEDRKKWASKKQRQRAESRGDEAESPRGTPLGIPGRDGSMYGSDPDPEKSDLPVKSVGTKLPHDWKPANGDAGRRWRSIAREKNFDDERVRDIFGQFLDHFTLGKGKNALHSSWDRTWQNWIANESPYRALQANGSGKLVQPSSGIDYDAVNRINAREAAERERMADEAEARDAERRRRDNSGLARGLGQVLLSRVSEAGAANGANETKDAPASATAQANGESHNSTNGGHVTASEEIAKRSAGVLAAMGVTAPGHSRDFQSSEDKRAKAEAFRAQVLAEQELENRKAGI